MRIFLFTVTPSWIFSRVFYCYLIFLNYLLKITQAIKLYENIKFWLCFVLFLKLTVFCRSNNHKNKAFI